MRNRHEKLTKGSLFCLFLKLVQINFIFTDNVRILYIYGSVSNLLTCGKYLHHFTLKRGDLKLVEPCNFLLKCLYKVMYLCVRGINFASLYKFSNGIWNCSDSIVFLVYHFILFICVLHYDEIWLKSAVMICYIWLNPIRGCTPLKTMTYHCLFSATMPPDTIQDYNIPLFIFSHLIPLKTMTYFCLFSVIMPPDTTHFSLFSAIMPPDTTQDYDILFFIFSAIMPPDTTQDYDIHLAHAVNDLQEFGKNKTLGK